MNATYVSFEFYSAIDRNGDVHTFRFMKGGDKDLLYMKVFVENLTDLLGPYKTKKAAKARQ